MSDTKQGTATAVGYLEVTNQTVEASNGITYAYRRLGSSADGIPIIFLMHFRGTLDNWDPVLVDAVAAQREVILVDNTGVGASTGSTPSTVREMAADLIAFTDALGLRQFDVFGFSLGGFVAQEIALTRPWALRSLILAGTGPAGAPRMHGWREDIARESRLDESTAQSLLYIFFAHTETSSALGVDFLKRIFARTEGRDEPSTLATRDAQYDSVLEWGIPDFSKLQRLTGIYQPTLIIQGDNDLMIPTPLSHLMAGLIPDARIHIFDDAAHASIFQYPAETGQLILDHIGYTTSLETANQ